MSDLQSNAAGAAKAEYHSIVIKDNGQGVHDECAICHQDHKPEIGPELFIEGTDRTVCYQCGKEHAPELVKALDELRKIEEQRLKDETDAKLKEALLEIYSTRQPQRVIRYDYDSPRPVNRRQIYGLENVNKLAVLIQPGVEKAEVITWLLQLTACLNQYGLYQDREPKDPVAFVKSGEMGDDDDDLFF